MNIIIPMAGAGTRFKEKGYSFPKPLIEIHGKPMIEVVVDNLGIKDAHFVFIARKEHIVDYALDSVLELIAPNSTVIPVEWVTEGAACTTLLAEDYIDDDRPLLYANCDQFLEWSGPDFIEAMEHVDGGIATFEATHPKWSFAKVNGLGYVTEVAEKKPISNIATCGIYYWKYGSDYVKYAKQMIDKDIRVNGEYYVCPVFNEAIADGKAIKAHPVQRMWGLGTPEDLEYFLGSYRVS